MLLTDKYDNVGAQIKRDAAVFRTRVNGVLYLFSKRYGNLNGIAKMPKRAAPLRFQITSPCVAWGLIWN